MEQKPKGNSRGNSLNGKSRKDERRQESYARQEVYARFSLKEKLARLPKDGAKRQRARYEAALDKQVDREAEANRQERKKERTQKAAQIAAQLIKGKE